MSQTARLLDLLLDGGSHSTPEILSVIYGGEHLGIARIAARCWDLKKQGHAIRSWRDPKKKTVTWYQLLLKPVSHETENPIEIFIPGKITMIKQTLFPLSQGHQ